MHCSACAHDNRPGAAFCGGCGTPLTALVTCSACGARNAEAQKFCDSCGASLAGSARKPAPAPRSYTPNHLMEKILTSRSALLGERKQVTVLFADIQGSMSLAEREDPEAWHAILDRFFVLLSEGVHRFEGTINQYTGDGIMALFGAPIAHEDHAQRACYAALHLRRKLAQYAGDLRRTRGLNFSVRMGLNSGEVVVGAIGDDLRMDYTALGHTVGLAARMEALAESGRGYLTGSTAALVEGQFELRDLGDFTVKGVSQPVRAYDLIGIGAHRSRFDVARARGLTKFVGRKAELAALEEALDQVVTGARIFVDVVGEPGVGKSRLAHEFLQRVRARGIRTLQTQGVSHGKALPLHPFIELFRQGTGIEESDSPEVARQKIAGSMLLIDPGMHERLPVLFELLGVPDPERPAPLLSPEARQQQVLEMIRRLSFARSRREPTVILYEDLHWFDDTSMQVLRHLAGDLTEPDADVGRTLLLANYRPDFDPPADRLDPVRRLHLEPLRDAEAGDLIREVLGADPSVARLARQVQTATQGNPFYIEEVVRGLAESRAIVGKRGAYRLRDAGADVAIPATVHAVLGARIDRLTERDKTVLQVAAVIGKRFTWSVLARVAGLAESDLRSALHRLIEAEFLLEEALYPEAEYAFRHPLTHDVAYRTQLAATRAEMHKAVAESMRALYGDAQDDRAGRIADHYAEAGVALEAARFYRRAAEWAARSAPREAAGYWRQVHTFAAQAEPTAETAELRLAACGQIMYLGWSYDLQVEEAERLYDEGLSLASQTGDPHGHARLLDAYARVRGGTGHSADSLALRKEALRLAERTTDVGLRVGLQTRLAGAYSMSGHLHDALDIAERALAEAGDTRSMGINVLGFDPYLRFLMRRGTLFAQMGRLTESARDLDQALHLARERGDRETLVSTHAAYVTLLDFLGQFPQALNHAVLAVELAEVSGVPYLQAVAYSALGRAHLLNEDWSAAIESTERAVGAVQGGRTFRVGEAWMRANLAWARLGQERLEEAEILAREAVELALQYGARVFECAARMALSRAFAALAGAAGAERSSVELVQAHRLAKETGALSYHPLVHADQAAVAERSGDRAGMREHLREAARLFAQIGAATRAERINHRLKSLTG